MNAPIKEEPKVISRPWDGSHPPPAPKEPTAAELATTILAGINAHRCLPDDGQVTASERALLQQGSEARNEAKGALRELVELSRASEVPAATSSIAEAAANLRGQLSVLESMSHEELVRRGAWVIGQMREAFNVLDGEVAGKVEP